MESLLFFVILFGFGMLFGSFATVLISRWKNGSSGIISGRSACPHCHHTLSARELIPLFSFLWQWGKCRHCHTKIPLRYPILECCMGLTFVGMGVVNSHFGFGFPSIPFFSLLFLWFITTLYIFYDIFYLEIPDESYILWIVWCIILFILASIFGFEMVYFNAWWFHTFHTFILDKIFWALLLYAFLHMQILIPGSLYLIQHQRKQEITELFILFVAFPFLVIWDFFQKYRLGSSSHNAPKNEDAGMQDIPTWIGSGDLLLAIMIGGTLGVVYGIIALLFAYVIGSIVGVCMLILGKSHPNAEKWRHEIPFWPFLGIGFFLTLLLYPPITEYLHTYIWLDF